MLPPAEEPAVKQSAGKIDWTGIFLLAIGVSALQTVLERGETEDWFQTGYIAALSAVAVLGLALFVWWELRVAQPVVNLRVLKSRNLSIAAILTFISGIGMFSSVFLTPVFAQRLLNFTPSQTGLLLLPGAVLAIGGLMVSARLLQKGIPPVALIATGICFFRLFSWQMSGLNSSSGAADVTHSLLFRGIGLAIVTVPLTSLAISSLALADVPQGAALNNMMRQLGGSFGIALVNTYLAQRSAGHRADLVAHITADNPVVVQRLAAYTQYFSSKGAGPATARQQALQLIDSSVTRQSGILSFNDAYLVVGGIFMLALPLLLLSVRRKGEKVQVVLSDH